MKDSRSSTQSVFDKWAALQNQTGFTLLEAMAVLALIGITSAIAAPSWLNFLEGSRLTTSRDQIHSAIRQTQMNAQRRGVPWEFNLREQNDSVEWSMHQVSVEPDTVQWESLDSASVQIDEETTFRSVNGVYCIRFNKDGNVAYCEDEDGKKILPLLGRITFSGKHTPTIKRCVFVSTILGAMRKSKEQSKPDSGGRTCY